MSQKLPLIVLILSIFAACNSKVDPALKAEVDQLTQKYQVSGNLDEYRAKVGAKKTEYQDSLAQHQTNVKYQLIMMPLNDLEDLIKKSEEINTLKASLAQILKDCESGKLSTADAKTKVSDIANKLEEARKNNEFLVRLMSEFDMRMNKMKMRNPQIMPVQPK